jgi:hypothetical protein
MSKFRLGAFLVAALAFAVPAQAVTVTFSGQDDGAPVGGPFPNSSAAETDFRAAAAAYGSVRTETFESSVVGTISPLVTQHFTVTTPAPDLGSGFSGVNDFTFGNLYGFNTTPGGTNWYGFPTFLAAEATVVFDRPTNSLGAWLTGVQTIFTTEIRIELIDGSMESFIVPLNVDGGAQFFGLVSTIPFTSVLVIQTNNPGVADAWGVDDVQFNVVPEPATWAMLIAGFGIVGVAARRRRIAAA